MKKFYKLTYSHLFLSLFAFFFSLTLSLSAQSWNEVSKLAASDRAYYDLFGNSVSISGNYAIVGAKRVDTDTSGANSISNAGSAYIFEKNSSGQWVEVQKLVANNRDSSDYFGFKVCMLDNQALVSSIGEDNDTNANVPPSGGAVYVFEKNGTGIWAQVQKITLDSNELNYILGHSLHAYNDFAIVGAVGGVDTINGTLIDNMGAAFIYQRDSTGYWNEVQKLSISDPEDYDNLGNAVHIDSNIAIVGAWTKDAYDSLSNLIRYAGAAYVFQNNGLGNWTQIQKLEASDRSFADRFGIAVSMSGSKVLVGADLRDTTVLNSKNTGAVYVFDLDSTGQWKESQILVPQVISGDDQFGYSIASSNGKVIIGAPNHEFDLNGANPMRFAGAAFIYELDSLGDFIYKQKILASDRTVSYEFGNSVGIYNDQIFVGSPYGKSDQNGNNYIHHAGNAYVFEYQSITSLSQVGSEKNFRIYPNPTTSEVTIDLGEVINQLQLNVFDLSGREVYNSDFYQQQLIHLNFNQAPGVYFVRLKMEDESTVLRLIKK